MAAAAPAFERGQRGRHARSALAGAAIGVERSFFAIGIVYAAIAALLMSPAVPKQIMAGAAAVTDPDAASKKS